MNELFPVFLKLENLHVLVVGAGAVGTEKTKAILSNSPQVTMTIVAPEISKELQTYIQSYTKVTYIQAAYDVSFLEGKDIVIAATCIQALNKQVYLDAKQRKVLINVADTPALCDFYLSSVVQKGNLKIGISTNGQSPTMAKRMREMLEEVLPEEMDELLKQLNEIRNQLKGDFEYKVEKMNEITHALKKQK